MAEENGRLITWDVKEDNSDELLGLANLSFAEVVLMKTQRMEFFVGTSEDTWRIRDMTVEFGENGDIERGTLYVA